jgi:dynein heavy chain
LVQLASITFDRDEKASLESEVLPNHFTKLKKFPTQLFQFSPRFVLEAICVMKGIKAERKNIDGKMVEDFWGPSLKMLGDMKFLESLKNYDKDNIPPSIMKQVRAKYIPDPDFDPVKIKTVSGACEGLCKWVKALDSYDRVFKIVAPKQEALAAAEAELSDQMKKLDAKRAQLKGYVDKLQALNDHFESE